MGSAHSSVRAHLGKNSWKRKIWWWTNIYITSTADVFLTTVKKYPGVYSCFVSNHRMELHAPVVLLLDMLVLVGTSYCYSTVQLNLKRLHHFLVHAMVFIGT
jgi:hypothetical protein